MGQLLPAHLAGEPRQIVLTGPRVTSGWCTLQPFVEESGCGGGPLDILPTRTVLLGGGAGGSQAAHWYRATWVPPPPPHPPPPPFHPLPPTPPPIPPTPTHPLTCRSTRISLQVGLFAPPEELSAAVAIETLYFYGKWPWVIHILFSYGMWPSKHCTSQVLLARFSGGFGTGGTARVEHASYCSAHIAVATERALP